MPHIIGFDAGFGNVKLWDKNGGSVHASHVSVVNRARLANTLSDAEDAMIIEFDDYKFYTGQYAGFEGLHVDGLNMDRLLGSLEIRAVFYGAMTQHMAQHKKIRSTVSVMCGLPFGLLDTDSYENTLSRMNGWLMGDHEWTANGVTHSLTVSDVTIKSQAVGAVLDYGLTITGAINKGVGSLLQGEIGVVSIGYNTIELMGLSGVRQVQALTTSDNLGVRRLLEILNEDGLHSLSVLDSQLRDGNINGRLATVLPTWSQIVTSYIGTEWGRKWRAFQKVIVVGGGALLLREDMLAYFEGKAHVPDLPIESVSRGLYKRGVADAQAR